MSDIKKVTSLNLHYMNVGSFALEKTPIQVEICRERFATRFTSKCKGFYFGLSDGKSTNVAKFIWKFESIVADGDMTSFNQTNKDNILWVMPSKFWKCCPLRRSLFTILLRAGLRYDPDKDNFEDALFNERYASTTKRAIMRFLFGFTKFTGEIPVMRAGSIQYQGWQYFFHHKDDSDIKNTLVSPNPVVHNTQLNSLLF